YGDTDTLSNIQKLILGPYDDTVTLNEPSGLAIDGGGYWNGDTVSYSGAGLTITITESDANLLVMDDSGKTDTLTDFQNFNVTGTGDTVKLAAPSNLTINGDSDGSTTVNYSADSSDVAVYQYGAYIFVYGGTDVDILTNVQNLVLSGGDNNDVVLNAPSGLTIDSGSGMTTVDYSADTSGLTITQSGANLLVTDGSGKTDTLTDLQHLNLILPNENDLVTLNGPSGVTITGGSSTNMIDYSADPHNLTVTSSGVDLLVTDGSGKTDTLVNVQHVAVGVGTEAVVTSNVIYTNGYQVSGADTIDSGNQGSVISVLNLGHTYINNFGDVIDYSHIGSALTMDFSNAHTVTDGHATDTFDATMPSTIIGTNYGDNITINVNTPIGMEFDPLFGWSATHLTLWTGSGNNNISFTGNLATVHYDPNTGLLSGGPFDTTIVYTGGNDVINNDAVNAQTLAAYPPGTFADAIAEPSYLPSIVLGAGITAADVSFQELNIRDVTPVFGVPEYFFICDLEIDIAGKGSILVPDVHYDIEGNGNYELRVDAVDVRLWDGEVFNSYNDTIVGTIPPNLLNLGYYSVHAVVVDGQNFLLGTTGADDYTVSPGEGNSIVVDAGGANTIHVTGGD
ncbi:MAG: hypothetical protein ACREBW_08915, partial [Candidatus Micrarchaeaceae archaeon]